MSIEIGVRYTCGGCGKTLFIPTSKPHKNGEQSTAGAFERAGWVNYVGHHICDECPHEPKQYSFYNEWLYSQGYATRAGQQQCSNCQGSGKEPATLGGKTVMVRCRFCGGKGYI